MVKREEMVKKKEPVKRKEPVKKEEMVKRKEVFTYSECHAHVWMDKPVSVGWRATFFLSDVGLVVPVEVVSVLLVVSGLKP